MTHVAPPSVLRSAHTRIVLLTEYVTHDADAGSGHPYPGTSNVPSDSWIPGPGVNACGLRVAAQDGPRCSCDVMFRGGDHVTPASSDVSTYVSLALGLYNSLNVLYCAGWRFTNKTTRPLRASTTGATLNMDALGLLAEPKSRSTLATMVGAPHVNPPSVDLFNTTSCRPQTAAPAVTRGRIIGSDDTLARSTYTN